MINKTEVNRITDLAHELIEQINDSSDDSQAVLEHFTIILAIAAAEETGVSEDVVSACSSAHCYVQEGLLLEALRAHDEGRRS